MALIPWKHDDLFNEDDWFFPVISRRETALNLYETDKEVVAEIGTMGMDPDKIEVSIGDEYIEVMGRSEEEEEEKERNYWKKEISKSSFEKTIKIPSNVDRDGIEAINENGVLKIVMPKREKEEGKRRKIDVKKK